MVERSRGIWTPGGVHLLIDPDKWAPPELANALSRVPEQVETIIVGGTFLHSGGVHEAVEACRATGLPVGSILSASHPCSTIDPRADFLLIPVLFGTADTRFVLDHVVQAVPFIRTSAVPCASYAYFVLEGGSTSTEFFTRVAPIPRGKHEILRTLALAAEYLGLEGLYLEGGSGTAHPVQPDEVAAVRDVSTLPILVGGGLNSAEQCRHLLDAGATGLIVGTAFEQSHSLTWLNRL